MKEMIQSRYRSGDKIFIGEFAVGPEQQLFGSR